MTTFISSPAGWAGDDPAMQIRVTDVIQGEQLMIRIAGDLDWATMPAVHHHLNALITARVAAHIVVNLADVDFCDTAAIRALMALAEAATGRGATFQVRGARVHIAWLCSQLGGGYLRSPTPAP